MGRGGLSGSAAVEPLKVAVVSSFFYTGFMNNKGFSNIVIVLIVLVVVGVGGYVAWQNDFFRQERLIGDGLPVVVTNFEECVAAGNPVMESYPGQCRHEGKTFVENITGVISFTDPLAGKIRQVGSVLPIRWTPSGTGETVTLSVPSPSKPGTQFYLCTLATCEHADTGEFMWTIPPDEGHIEWPEEGYPITLERSDGVRAVSPPVVITYPFGSASPSNFEECIAAGNPVMESYPRQCRDGKRLFVEEIGVVSISDILGNPSDYVGEEVVLRGLLYNAGTNYFTDLSIVLKDSVGDEIGVLSWLPLEFPPAPEGVTSSPRQSDFLDKTVQLTGEVQLRDSVPFLRVTDAEIER